MGHVEKCSRALAVLLGTSPPDGSIRASIRALLVAETLRGGASQEVATFVRSLAALIADAATRARPAPQRASTPLASPARRRTETAVSAAIPAPATALSPCEAIPPIAVSPPGPSVGGDVLSEVAVNADADGSSVSALPEVAAAHRGHAADAGFADDGVRGWMSPSRPAVVTAAVGKLPGGPPGNGGVDGAVEAAAGVTVDGPGRGGREEGGDVDDPADISIRDREGAAAYASALVHMARSRKKQREAALLAEAEAARVAALAEQEAERRRKYKKGKSKKGAWALKKQQAMVEAAQNVLPPASARLWPPTVVGDLPGAFPFSRSGGALLLHARAMVGLKRAQRWARAWLSLPEGSSSPSPSLSGHVTLPSTPSVQQAPTLADAMTSAVALATSPPALAAAEQYTFATTVNGSDSAVMTAAIPPVPPVPAQAPAPVTLAQPVAVAAASLAESAPSTEGAPLVGPPHQRPAAAAAADPVAALAADPVSAFAAAPAAASNTPVATTFQPSTPLPFVPPAALGYPQLLSAVGFNDGVPSTVPAQNVAAQTWPAGPAAAAAAAAAAAFAGAWGGPAAAAVQAAHSAAMAHEFYPLLAMAANSSGLSGAGVSLGMLPSPSVASCGGAAVGGGIVAGLPAAGVAAVATHSAEAGVGVWNTGVEGSNGRLQEEEEEDEDEINVVDV